MNNKFDNMQSNIAWNLPIWDISPREKKIYKTTELLCGNHINLQKYYTARPYNFLMNTQQWSSIENTIELLMAIRFGMEWDTYKISDTLFKDPDFHQKMYNKFHDYVLKHSQKEVDEIIREFEHTAFRVRFLSTFSIENLINLKDFAQLSYINFLPRNLNDLKYNHMKLDRNKASKDLLALKNNAGPLYINEKMFKEVFNL